MSKSYQKPSGKSDPILATKRQASKQLVHLVSEHGHVLLPMVQLIQQSKLVVSDVIMDLGRTMLEAMLEISAAEAAGPPHQGKRTASDIVRHGRQSGYVTLADRKLAVTRPRLRRRGSGENGEVEVPAYAAMQNGSALQDQILNCMMRGVTTRNFSQIVPDSCDAVGISKSSVSRQFVLAQLPQFDVIIGPKILFFVHRSPSMGRLAAFWVLAPSFGAGSVFKCHVV